MKNYYKSLLSNEDWFKSLEKSYLSYINVEKYNLKKKVRLHCLFVYYVEEIFFLKDSNYYKERLKKNSEIKILKILSIFKYLITWQNKNLSEILLKLNISELLSENNKYKFDNFRLKLLIFILNFSKIDYEKEKREFLLKNKDFIKDTDLYKKLIKYLPSQLFIDKNDLSHSKFYCSTGNFLMPKATELLVRIKYIYIKEKQHGAVQEWYLDSYLSKRRRAIHNEFIKWDSANPSSIHRYTLKPKKIFSKPNIYWIARDNGNNYQSRLEPSVYKSLGKKESFKAHLNTINKILSNQYFKIVLHPKGSPKEYDSLNKDNCIGLNMKEVKQNDILIFDSINSSLVFYAIKYKVNFIIYNENFELTKATNTLREFIDFLQKNNHFYLRNEKEFASEYIKTLERTNYYKF